ncbi:hypothetical protein [Cryptosporangium sp. NPDC048952]|uniref:hypothetical protein n=1 Tax=Cryptosporangium sp. NPDC048952 TaxID=3363961 RepID=UPI0037235367
MTIPHGYDRHETYPPRTSGTVYGRPQPQYTPEPISDEAQPYPVQPYRETASVEQTYPPTSWQPQPAPAYQPPPRRDPIEDSDEYRQAFAHYRAQGAPADHAHDEAYRWAAQQLAARLQQPAQPSVVINNQVGAYAAATVAPGYGMPRKIGLSGGAHTLHLVATVLTCGLWAPVWIIHAVLAGRTVR